jgi:hypothetical protein
VGLAALEGLSLGRFRVTYRVTRPLDGSSFFGSALRGAFGTNLRHLTCPSHAGVCDSCGLRGACAYAYVFDTQLPEGSDRLRTHREVPRPFVLEPPPPERSTGEHGRTLVMHVTLFGRALDYLALVLTAFSQVHHVGASANLELEEVRVSYAGFWLSPPIAESWVWRPGGNWPASDPPSVRGSDILQRLPQEPVTALELDFATMTRLKYEGDQVRRPEFHVVVRNLLRRLANIAYFHGGGELDVDFRGLIEAAQRVALTSDRTRWVVWERYSSRQKAAVNLGGFVGSASYSGELSDFLPFLLLGQYSHVGKNATFGLGRYIVRV